MLHYSPTWSGVHPLIAHTVPILLLAAPFLVMLAIGLSPHKRQLFLMSALGVMILGTTATFLALATGEAAVAVVNSTPASEIAVEEHRTLAETTSELFSVLTLAFAALVFAPKLLQRELRSRINTALLAVFLVFYATGAIFLVHTALHGGRLVRELQANSATTYRLTGQESAR